MAKIGIINLADSRMGGIFNYAVNLIQGLLELGGHDYVVFYGRELGFEPGSAARAEMIGGIPVSKFGRACSMLFGVRTAIDKAVEKRKLDLLVCPSATLTGFHFKIPYIVAIHDLMHRYHPEFAEYAFPAGVMRDAAYRRSCGKAAMIVADSEMSRNDLNRFYGLAENRIRVVPFSVSRHIVDNKGLTIRDAGAALKKFALPEEFVFYPAQFWEQKNHSRLLRAIASIRNKYGITVPLVLAGSKREGYTATMRLADELGLRDSVFHPGFVSDLELVALYKKSKALVYPSLIGPTNIPPLEAMVLGTPVICSNLFAMPEQIGEAGLLFDPMNVEELASKIYAVWSDADLRRELAAKGLERGARFLPDTFASRWKAVVDGLLTS